MTDLLTQLGWKLAPTEPQKRTTDAPPPPPNKPNNGGGNHDKWAHAVFNQLENLLWQIEDKGWKSSIHIEKDVVKVLHNIPASFVRSVMAGITPEDYPALSRYIIRGS